MNKFFALAALITLSSIPALAQGTPSVEFSAGYVYRSYKPVPDGSTPPPARLNMNGLGGGIAYNVNDVFTVATDFDWTRNNQGQNGTLEVSTLEVGPRIYLLGHHRIAPFGEFLIGLSNTRIYLPPSGGEPSLTATDGSFGFSVGGGVDVNLTRHFGLRLVEFDYDQTRTLDFSTSGLSDKNNNFKLKAGILIHFGEK